VLMATTRVRYQSSRPPKIDKEKASRTEVRAALRILDANANRALEGLRVCEEVARLYWERVGPYRKFRDLRHAVSEALHEISLPYGDLLRARDSKRDIGRDSSSDCLNSLDQLLRMNLQRVKEALRALEECSRIVAPDSRGAFQMLRFRTYGIERDVLLELETLRNH